MLSLSFGLIPAALSLSPFLLTLCLALYLFSLLLLSLSLIPFLSFFFPCLPSFLFFYRMSRQGHTTARGLLVSSFLMCFIHLEPKRQQGWLEQAEALGHTRQRPASALPSAPPRDIPPGLGGMGQLNCCLGSRWVLTVAWGHTGTARPHSTCLSHARRCLLCRDDSGPVQQPIPPSAKPLLREAVQVTQGRTTSKRDLLLFQDILIIAKLKTHASDVGN